MKGIKLSAETKISIVGGRCKNIDDDQYPWLTRLKEWLETGATIHYLLIEATSESKEKLTKLSAEFPDKFQAFYIEDVSAIEDDETRRLADESRTTHFTLFDKPMLIWLEGFHPDGSKEAYNCEFVDQKRAKRDSRYQGLEQLFARFCKEAEKQEHLVLS
jgi:hypothetical protein